MEEENQQLKEFVVYLSLEKQMFQEVIKKTLKETQKQGLIQSLLNIYWIFNPHICAILRLRHLIWFYKAHRRDSSEPKKWIREIDKPAFDTIANEFLPYEDVKVTGQLQTS